MHNHSCFRFGFLLPTLLVSALQAEDNRYGVEVHLALPRNDLKSYVDRHQGYGLGAFETIDILDGRVLRPRVDFTVFPEVSLADARQEASTLSLGGDYLYFFKGKPEWFYVCVGLAGVRWSLSNQTPASKITTTTTKLGVTLGLGCHWSEHMGGELRWTTSSLSSTFKANTLQAALSVRF